MASAKLFEDIPPFPDDVPTAPLRIFSLASVRSGEEAISRKLLLACQELGFFLLDLSGDDIGESLMTEIDQLLDVDRELMGLDPEVKKGIPFDYPNSVLGLKPLGLTKTETSEADRFEAFNLGTDGLVGNDALQPLPPVLAAQLPLFKSFLSHGQHIVSIVATTLATQLGLSADTFTSMMPPAKRSGTLIRLLKSHASLENVDIRTSMVGHTDYGTITLLANVIGGLQILTGTDPHDRDAWSWVKPKPGCLIVNMGDAMVQWTGGLLRSNMHRVSYAPGQQRFVDRYSVALLMRPERDAAMKRLVGDGGDDGPDSNLTAWEWEMKKATAIKNENFGRKKTLA